ncbi:hypothetical protein A2U01_0032249 [Trifolium medium]|uniref:Uncharacterized protein n=1 Tax=Trifolium medium TaxID=97028 RepID=A0A392PI40_9FABA|nr:hypothetical protein [Trifolium medium]
MCLWCGFRMSTYARALSIVKVRSSSLSEHEQPFVSEEFPFLEGPRDSMPHYLFCRGRDMVLLSWLQVFLRGSL